MPRGLHAGLCHAFQVFLDSSIKMNQFLPLEAICNVIGINNILEGYRCGPIVGAICTMAHPTNIWGEPRLTRPIL